MPNFSIVIPLYNESTNIEKLVPEIFHSLTKYQKYELILINDGSNDTSVVKIAKLVEQDSAITLIDLYSNTGWVY